MFCFLGSFWVKYWDFSAWRLHVFLVCGFSSHSPKHPLELEIASRPECECVWWTGDLSRVPLAFAYSPLGSAPALCDLEMDKVLQQIDRHLDLWSWCHLACVVLCHDSSSFQRWKHQPISVNSSSQHFYWRSRCCHRVIHQLSLLMSVRCGARCPGGDLKAELNVYWVTVSQVIFCCALFAAITCHFCGSDVAGLRHGCSGPIFTGS